MTRSLCWVRQQLIQSVLCKEDQPQDRMDFVRVTTEITRNRILGTIHLLWLCLQFHMCSHCQSFWPPHPSRHEASAWDCRSEAIAQISLWFLPPVFHLDMYQRSSHLKQLEDQLSIFLLDTERQMSSEMNTQSISSEIGFPSLLEMLVLLWIQSGLIHGPWGFVLCLFFLCKRFRALDLLRRIHLLWDWWQHCEGSSPGIVHLQRSNG